MSGIKRDKYDVIFSQLIRERADFHCERCGKSYRERTQGLHCSHFYTRSNKAVRWCVINAAAHCHGCHHYLGSNPIEFTAWVRGHLGDTLFDELNFRRQAIIKWKPWDKAAMYLHYQEELAKLQERRKAGEVGYIEVTDYI